MKARATKFAKDLTATLLHCAADETEFLTPAVLLLVTAGFIWIFTVFCQVGYEILTDPNSTNVAHRLAQLSIDPPRCA